MRKVNIKCMIRVCMNIKYVICWLKFDIYDKNIIYIEIFEIIDKFYLSKNFCDLFEVITLDIEILQFKFKYIN